MYEDYAQRIQQVEDMSCDLEKEISPTEGKKLDTTRKQIQSSFDSLATGLAPNPFIWDLVIC